MDNFTNLILSEDRKEREQHKYELRLQLEDQLSKIVDKKYPILSLSFLKSNIDLQNKRTEIYIPKTFVFSEKDNFSKTYITVKDKIFLGLGKLNFEFYDGTNQQIHQIFITPLQEALNLSENPTRDQLKNLRKFVGGKRKKLELMMELDFQSFSSKTNGIIENARTIFPGNVYALSDKFTTLGEKIKDSCPKIIGISLENKPYLCNMY